MSESETITYDFLSLEDPYNGAPTTFAAYRDINHSWFEPYDPNFSSSRKSKEEHMKCTVTVVYAEDTEIVVDVNDLPTVLFRSLLSDALSGPYRQAA